MFMKTTFALLLSVIGATALNGCASGGLEEEDGGESVGTAEQAGIGVPITPPSTPPCPIGQQRPCSGCACLTPPVQVTYDTSTACNVGGVWMHCCPSDKAMVGVHLGQNTFKCASLTSQSGAGVVFLDAGTVRNNMHACPLGSVMVGLHRDLNLLACRWVSSITGGGRVDASAADGFPMHVCQNPVNTEAMTGIHADQNLLNCTGDAKFFRSF